MRSSRSKENTKYNNQKGKEKQEIKGEHKK
jgi:hypothetical protein